MKIFSRWIAMVSTVAICLTLSVPVASAATTIGSNIATGGTLNVTGLSTLSGGLTDGTATLTGGALSGATGAISQWTNDAGYLLTGSNISLLTNDAGFMMAGANISNLTNDLGFIDGASVTANETDPSWSGWLAGNPNIDLDTTDDFAPISLFADYGFTDNSANWDAAVAWGDHSLAGYINGAAVPANETDPSWSGWLAGNPNIDLDTTDDFAPTSLFADYGFTDNSANWDAAVAWGDHSLAGYINGAAVPANETDPAFTAATGAAWSGTINVDDNTGTPCTITVSGGLITATTCP